MIALASRAAEVPAAAPAPPSPVLPDGQILDSQPCTMPFASYDEWLSFLAARPSADPRDRPEMEEPYRTFMPSYELRKEERLDRRSAVRWPEKLRTLLLLLHGGADWRVSPEEAFELRRGLEQHGANYRLVLFGGDDHPLSRDWPLAEQMVLDWFAAHRKTP